MLLFLLFLPHTVPCGAGTYFDIASDKCRVCELGTYQDEQGALECKACPAGSTTLSPAAINLTQCVGKPVKLVASGRFSPPTERKISTRALVVMAGCLGHTHQLIFFSCYAHGCGPSRMLRCCHEQCHPCRVISLLTMIILLCTHPTLVSYPHQLPSHWTNLGLNAEQVV